MQRSWRYAGRFWTRISTRRFTCGSEEDQKNAHPAFAETAHVRNRPQLQFRMKGKPDK